MVEVRLVECDSEHTEVEAVDVFASGVVAVHDELVRLIRELVTNDSRTAGSPTFAQHSLLSFVARNPGCRATQISDAFGVHRSTVSRQLRGCLDEGWVHAEKGPLRSGHPLTLTEWGVAVLASAEAHRIEEVRTRLNSWSDSDIDAFARQLREFRLGATALGDDSMGGDGIGGDGRA